MSNVELELHVDDEFYASASGPRDEVYAEMRRYWATCCADSKCTVYEVRRVQISIDEVLGQETKVTTANECWCRICNNDRLFNGLPWASTRMIVCPDCGNKRCPKATNHTNACTQSNESGQPGSVY